MADLTPVDYNPFATSSSELVPVDYNPFQQTARKSEDVGTIEGAMAAIPRGFESLEDIGSGFGVGASKLFGTPEETAAKMQAIKEKQAKVDETPATSFADLERIYQEKGLLPALGEVPKYIAEQTIQNAPQMAGPLAVGAGVGAFTTPIGGAIAGIGAYGVQQFGNFLNRQAQEAKTPEDINVGRAGLAAAITAPIGYFADKFTMGIGGLGERALSEVAKELTFRSALNVGAKAVGKGAVEGIIAEAPTEVLEQFIERAQAGLSLTDDDAIKEYKEAFFGAAGSGGATKGVMSGARVAGLNSQVKRGEQENYLLGLPAPGEEIKNVEPPTAVEQPPISEKSVVEPPVQSQQEANKTPPIDATPPITDATSNVEATPIQEKQETIAQEPANQVLDQADKLANEVAPETPVETPVEIADEAPAEKQVAQEKINQPIYYGVNSIPMGDDGFLAFNNKADAQAEKRLQPTMYVKKISDGWVLAPKSEAQLAAEKNVSKRLGGFFNKWQLSAHEFIASLGGLSPDEKADLGIEKNQRIGNKWLFAANGKGLSIEDAVLKLQEAGYLDTDDHNAAYELIKRSLKEPQYALQDVDQIAEEKIRARQEAEYEDHLKAQQDIDNPFGSLSDDGYSSDHLNDTGFYEASDDIKKEVAALSSLAEQHGIDIAGIQFDTALQSPNNTGNEFYEKYKSALTAAIEKTEQGSSRNISENNGEQAQGLTSPTEQEIKDSIARTEQISKENAQAQADAEKSERENQLSRDIQSRNEAASRNFQLGQSAEDNLSGQDALFSKTNNAGDDSLSSDVQKVIDDLNKINPKLLADINIKVGNVPAGFKGLGVAGYFHPITKVIRLMRGTEGVSDPSVLRHEIGHSLEQMMTPATRKTMINEYRKKLAEAATKAKTPQEKEYFKKIIAYMGDPSFKNRKAVLEALPRMDLYQYANPSEYWAENSEKLLKLYINGSWQRFKLGAKGLIESIKNTLGLPNDSVVYKAFKQTLNGERFSNKALIKDLKETRVRTVENKPAPAASFLSPPVSNFDTFIRAVQDNQVDLKKIQGAIEADGKTIGDAFNAYQKEELSHDRIASRLNEFLNKKVLPTIKLMHQLKVTQKEINDYRHNLHAEERNDQLNKANLIPDSENPDEMIVNPRLADRGSGIHTKDARNYLKNLPEDKRKNLEKVSKEIDGFIKEMQEALVHYGLETQETIDKWNETYKHYSPLFREDQDFVSSNSGTPTQGAGGTSRRAMGSTLDVKDIFESVAKQYERNIIRGENNIVRRALYGMALKFPNPKLWLPYNPELPNKENLSPKDYAKIIAGKREELESFGVQPEDVDNLLNPLKRRYIDPVTGLVDTRFNPADLKSTNVLAFRENGEDRYLLMNPADPRAMHMAEALNNADIDQLNMVMSNIGKVTRFIASINTQYNPVFGVKNFLRDGLGVGVNLSSTPLRGKQLAVYKEAFNSMKGIWNALKAQQQGRELTTEDGEYAKIFKEMKFQGGGVGFRNMFTNNQDVTAMQKEFAKLNRGNANKMAHSFVNMLGDFNEVLENSFRVATYKVAKDSGLSQDKAASLSKNISVNFNRRGSATRNLSALYAFFNASVQGTARLAQTIKGPAGKRIVIGGMSIGLLQSMMLGMAGYGDDDPPEFVKEKNFIIPMLDGTYASIPMPPGLLIFPNAGRLLGEALFNGKKGSDAIFNLANVMLDAFNPVGSSENPLLSLSPTITDPLVAVVSNKDAFGRPISKEDNPLKPTPGYLRSRDASFTVSRGIAEFINYISGGTEFTKGHISPTADDLEYMVGQMTGGVGRIGLQGLQSISNAATGVETPPHKLPFIGSFYGDTKSDANTRSKFYQNIQNASKLDYELRERTAQGKDPSGFIANHPEVRNAKVATTFNGYIQKLNGIKKQLQNNGASESELRDIEKRKLEMMKQFNEIIKR